MSTDPGLAGDSCIYVEAIANDGGIHNAAGVWWFSPDLDINPMTPNHGNAVSDADNNVVVTVRKRSNCTLPPGTESILVDVFVCDPAMGVPHPSDPVTQLKRINPVNTPQTPNSIPPANIPSGGSTPLPITWHPLSTSTDADRPGPHKCLIVRTYPNSLSPDGGDFHVPDDPHVAQHNLAIIATSKPSPAPREELFHFNISTTNPNRQEAQAATIRIVADLSPAKNVIDFLIPRLQEINGFRRIANLGLPQGFNLRLPDFPNATVQNNSRLGFLGFLLYLLFLLLSFLGIRIQFPFTQPKYEAQIQLQPGQFTTFTFEVDLSSAQRGDAHVFHLMHVGPDQRVIGGFTVVPVVV